VKKQKGITHEDIIFFTEVCWWVIKLIWPIGLIGFALLTYPAVLDLATEYLNTNGLSGPMSEIVKVTPLWYFVSLLAFVGWRWFKVIYEVRRVWREKAKRTRK